MNKLIINIIYLFIFIYPWGKFFDKLIFSSSIQTGSKGISTFLLLIIIILGIFNKAFIRGFTLIQRKISLVIFFSLTFFATLFSNTPEKIYSDFINLIVYFLLIFVVVGIKPSQSQIMKMLKILLFSTFTMAFLSLADYLNFINVPYFNEGYSNIYTGNKYIFDLTGPFSIRTEISFHLVLAIFFPILFIFSKNLNLFSRLKYLSIFIILFVASFLTNSRSIFVSLGFCFIIFALTQLKYRGKFSLKGLSIFIFIFVVVIISSLYINDSNIFLRVFGSESDFTRIYALKATLLDIIYSPIGAGIDMPYLEEIGGYKDVHNSFTYMLRAGGFIGFISLIYFFKPLLMNSLKSNYSGDKLIVLFPILSLLIFGLFHTSIQVATFWLILSLLISVNINQTQKK